MSGLLEHVEPAVEMDVARDEQVGQVREQPDVEVDVVCEQRHEVVIIGGDEDAQCPQEDGDVFGFHDRFLRSRAS